MRQNWVSRIVLFFFIAHLVNSFVSCNEVKKCGKVFDGLTDGRFDLNVQTSLTTIAANWRDFGDDVLLYEWAVISDSVRVPPSSLTPDGCYEELRLKPDIKEWEEVGKQTSAMQTKLSLRLGKSYYVLVRPTFRTGHQLIAISNGVHIISSFAGGDDIVHSTININKDIITTTTTTTDYDDYNTNHDQHHHHHVIDNNNNNDYLHSNNLIFGKQMMINHEIAARQPSSSSSSLHLNSKRSSSASSSSSSSSSSAVRDNYCGGSPFDPVCSIDNANRCRQSQSSVHDYLNQIYGKAKFEKYDNADANAFSFIRPTPIYVIVEETRHYDDDDGTAPAWILAPVLGFVFGLFLLALCIVLLIFCLCCCGKKSKQVDRDYGNIEDNLDGKDYGNRGGVNKADTDTNTKVEFPDTNIRRLSVDHNDEEEVAGEIKGTRRKHPITSSASSSFRDYRSVNQ